MCCPFLKHLNLSCCKSITDAAFALFNSKNNISSAASTSHTPQPGYSLTSIDISGCQSLSAVAVKYLVGLCGANLTSINLAWSGISCTALLYLAGLNMEKVARMMCFADPAVTDSVPPSSEVKQKLACANLHESSKALCGNHDFSNHGFLDSNTVEETAEDTYDFSESQLNEIEVSKLKDVLPIPCDPSLLQSAEGILHLQEANESPEVPGHEELTSDVHFIPICSSFLPGKVTSSRVYEQESTSGDEQLLETEDKEKCVYSDEDIVSKATEMERTFCWDVPSEVEPLRDSRMRDESFNSALLPLLPVPMKNEHSIERNPTTLATAKKSIGELETKEIHEDGFDTESHPVEDQLNHVYAVGLSSPRIESGIPSAPLEVLKLPRVPLVNGLKSDIPTMPCEEVKVEESTSNCLGMYCPVMRREGSGHSVMTLGAVKHENSVRPVIPSVESHEMDEEAEFGEPGMHCKIEEVEKSVLSMEPCKKETDYSNVSLSTIPCAMSETAESLIWSITPHKDEKGSEFDHSVTTCWEDKSVLPKFETGQDEQSSPFVIFPDIGATAEKSLRDCTLSPSKVIQVTDLLQAQLFQPQISSLDISGMSYHSKPLGQACLKIFSQANKCLKNFAVSWSELDDRMLTYLLKNEPELECLSLVC